MKGKLSNRLSIMGRLVCLALVIFIVLGGMVSANVKGTKSKSRAFFGLHGDANNNFDFASSRYGVVAPFAPSPDENGIIPESLDMMDNHFVYLFDTQKPKSEPIAADLRYCYYPSQVYFDEGRSVVLARGVEYVEPEGGQPYIGDILVHMKLNLETDRKPYFEDTSLAPIRIEASAHGYDGDSPNNFFLAHNDNIVVLTNGEAIITINRAEGYQYPVYFTGKKITHLDYDDSSRLVTVGLSEIAELEDGSCDYSSEVRYYELESSGVINLKVRLTEDQFPEGTGVMPGTQSVVSGSEVAGNKVLSFRAYIPSSDGSLWSVNFVDSAASGSADAVKFLMLGHIPELAEKECGEYPSPRLLTYDSSQRSLTIVKRGSSRRIIRPSLASRRPRGIIRPSLLEVRADPAVVIVQFDKKGNLASYKVFREEFEGKGGLSNLVTESGISYIATYSGDLFALSPDTVLTKAGNLGPRVSYISKAGDGAFVGVSSFELDGDGRFLSLGSLITGKVLSD